jgi:hypothetical protein
LWSVFAAAPVAAAEAAATAAAASDAEAEYEEKLEPLVVGQQVSLDILLAELFGHLQANAAVLVVDLTLRLITKYRICLVYLFELDSQMKYQTFLASAKTNFLNTLFSASWSLGFLSG